MVRAVLVAAREVSFSVELFWCAHMHVMKSLWGLFPSGHVMPALCMPR